jgi:hypothetical protein
MKYDNVKIPKNDNDETPKCKHEFTEGNLITEYSDNLCIKLIQFGREGNFIQGFPGKYNICSKTFNSVWLDRENTKYEKFRSAAKTAMSACFHFYNSELLHAIANYETLGPSIPILRSILMDLIKMTPKSILDLQFEDIDKQETEEERRQRLDREQKQKLASAFHGITDE